MATTYLQLVNSVLIRLRKDQAFSVQDTTYTQLIGEFVNETKREVEDAYDWKALKTVLTVTTSAGTQGYTLTGTNERTRIYDAYNYTDKNILEETTDEFINQENNLTTTQSGQPVMYVVSGQDSSTGSLTINLWPIPNGTKTLKFYAINPAAELSSDTDTTKMPKQAVVAGAWARAISERGEDGGRMAEPQFDIYKSTLADYIAVEVGRDINSVTWRRV